MKGTQLNISAESQESVTRTAFDNTKIYECQDSCSWNPTYPCNEQGSFIFDSRCTASIHGGSRAACMIYVCYTPTCTEALRCDGVPDLSPSVLHSGPWRYPSDGQAHCCVSKKDSTHRVTFSSTGQSGATSLFLKFGVLQPSRQARRVANRIAIAFDNLRCGGIHC